MTSLHAVASQPVAGISRDDADSAGFVASVQDSQSDLQFLVEIDTFQGSLTDTGWLGTPVAAAPIAALGFSAAPDAGQTTLYFSDRGYIGEPTDGARANIYYEPRATQPLSLARTIPVTPEARRRLSLSVGDIELINADAALDDVVRNFGLDGQTVKVLVGPGPTGGVQPAFTEFALVFCGLGRQWSNGIRQVGVSVRDNGYRLTVPLQTNRYTGNGGAEGTVDVEGMPKPLAFGLCRNIPALLVDPATLTYQLHDGPMQAVDAVYDRGVALTLDANYADYTTLIGASLAAGEYATALSAGLIRLASTPDEPVTADVRGDATGGYVDTHGDIMVRILTARAGLSVADLRIGLFDNLPAGAAGIFVSEETTIADVMDQLSRSCAAWWGTNARGEVLASRVTVPTVSAAGFALDETTIISIDREELPAVPRQRQRVNYQRNWRVQDGADIGGSVSDVRRQFLVNEWRTATAAAANTVAIKYPFAPDLPPLNSLFDTEADAQVLADFLIELHARDREQYSVTLRSLGYLIDIGVFVRVSYPRFGLANMPMAVVGHEVNAARNEVVLTLWG